MCGTEGFQERGLHVGATRVVSLGLVVELVANDRGMILHMVDQRDDDPLRGVAEDRVGDVHVLPTSVLRRALRRDDEHFRVFFSEPGGDRVGRGPDDDVDSGLVHRVEHTVDVRKVENAGLGFQRSPGGFGDANDGDVGRLHHLDVLVEAVRGGVLLVVSRAEEDGLGQLRCLGGGGGGEEDDGGEAWDVHGLDETFSCGRVPTRCYTSGLEAGKKDVVSVRECASCFLSPVVPRSL